MNPKHKPHSSSDFDSEPQPLHPTSRAPGGGSLGFVADAAAWASQAPALQHRGVRRALAALAAVLLVAFMVATTVRPEP